ncbi:hypothetical protein HDU86_001758 [Geranomyces michiganensis]|nr:hypothetical protein HDU86_001758 [Geranomyces michiganensis]
MTKKHSATTPTLQSFFQAQKAPNTRSRAKSLKTPQIELPISAATIKRKLAAAVAPDTESPCLRSGTKRRAEEDEIGAGLNTADTVKRQKREAEHAQSLSLTPAPHVEELSEPGTPSVSDSPALSTPSKSVVSTCKPQTGFRQTPGTPTPSRPARELASRTTAPSSTRSHLKYAVIETPRRTGLQQALPSPGGDDLPEIHDPREQPSRLRQLLTQSTKLPLPEHYQALEKMFLGLEGSATISRARGELCIYHKIRKAVEYQCGRNFEMRNLAQIRTVYPEAYTYAHIITINQGVRVASVCIDVPDQSKQVDAGSQSSSLKTPNKVSSVIRGGTLAAPIVSALDSTSMRNLANSAGNLMQNRRAEFHTRLEKIVRIAHSEFLKTIDHSPSGADSELRAWHPQFDLDAMPEIEPADMPELREALPDFRSPAAKARQIHEPPKNSESLKSIVPALAATPRASKTLEAASTKPLLDAQLATPPCKTMPTVAPATPSKSKTGAAAILERVRERARKKAEAEMYGPRKDTPAEIRKKAMLSRLGLVAQALNFIYSLESKNVLNINHVVRRLANSLSASLSEAEALEHLKLLAQVAPEYCELTDLSLLGTQVRINRSVTLAMVKETIAKVVADMDADKNLPRVGPGTSGTPTPAG